LRTGTFFKNSQLSYKNIVELLFSWSFKEPVNHATVLTGLSEKTVVQWFAYFRDVCSWWLVENTYQIGGPGHEVEIDESLIARRKKQHAEDSRTEVGLWWSG